MRKPTTSSLLPALLCVAALFIFACNRGGETSTGQVSNPAPPQVAQTQILPAALEPAPRPEAEIAREEARSTTVTVPAGTHLDVELTRTLASNTSSPGDSFRARVSDDVIVDGVAAIPRGSEILGEVTGAVPLKRVGGQARLALKLTDLVLPSGKTVPIGASFIQGAVLGRILGNGTAIASKIPGEEVIIPEGAVVSLRLDDAVRLRAKVPR
jgi:hypothetical protein